MKNQNDHAIIVSCNPGYEFGMIATMNAMEYFNTNADWEIAYEDFTDGRRAMISSAFDFNVHWTHVSELMETVVDRRTDQTGQLNRFWLAYWLMAEKALKKGYKSVCVIQADQFVFVNLNNYFMYADTGFLVCSEHAFTGLKAVDCDFGNDKSIWDRSMCPIFDSVNFISQAHKDMPRQIVEFQCEDAFKGEASHSVIALNRALCKFGKKDTVIGLPGKEWACDSIWPELDCSIEGDEVHTFVMDRPNIAQTQLKSWHSRWWQKDRCLAEFRNNKKAIVANKDNVEFMAVQDRVEKNYNVVKSFMERFNDMTPAIRSDNFQQGIIRRPRYEIGES